jgi:hypothetical protein
MIAFAAEVIIEWREHKPEDAHPQFSIAFGSRSTALARAIARSR